MWKIRINVKIGYWSGVYTSAMHEFTIMVPYEGLVADSRQLHLHITVKAAGWYKLSYPCAFSLCQAEALKLRKAGSHLKQWWTSCYNLLVEVEGWDAELNLYS